MSEKALKIQIVHILFLKDKEGKETYLRKFFRALMKKIFVFKSGEDLIIFLGHTFFSGFNKKFRYYYSENLIKLVTTNKFIDQ